MIDTCGHWNHGAKQDYSRSDNMRYVLFVGGFLSGVGALAIVMFLKVCYCERVGTIVAAFNGVAKDALP